MLRRDPAANVGQSDRATEYALLVAAARGGVPVPQVRTLLEPDDALGAGFLMDRIEGETIARRILREDAYADARPQLDRAVRRVAFGTFKGGVICISQAFTHLDGVVRRSSWQRSAGAWRRWSGTCSKSSTGVGSGTGPTVGCGARGCGTRVPRTRRHDGEARALEVELAAAIRHGALDDRLDEVRAHLRATVCEKLLVANPAHLVS